MKDTNLDTLTRRLDRLERENRWWSRLMILACVVALGLSVLVSGCSLVHTASYLEATKADKAGHYEKAARLYRFVSAEDSEFRQVAQFRLAEMHLEGTGITRDPREALRLLQEAAEGRDRSWRGLASSRLGRLFEEGFPGFIERDRVKAAHFYRKAAEDGNRVAADELERISGYPDVFVALNESEFKHHESSRAPAGMRAGYEAFTAGDHKRAFEVFLWHAKNGNAEAQAAVAVFYRNGLFVTADLKRHVAWTYLAARNGNRRAQLELGLLYRTSDIVPVDDDEARKWFRAASEQGEAEATNHLGVLLLHPFSRDRRSDPYGALRYFRQAADAGSTHALVNLGDAYLEGLGVERDEGRAKEYYLAAASRGNVTARQRLFERFNVMVGQSEEESESRTAAASPTPRSGESTPSRQTERRATQLSAVELYAALSGSVLRLYAMNVGEQGESVAQGSAVALTKQLAATNCHVLQGKETYGAKTGRGVILFRLVAEDRERDVCVVRADAELAATESVRRYEELKVGERVYAIGSPKGLENTMSEGIISGLRRGRSARYIQITAPITQGSSGGGLFDEQGRLIGITTFRADPSGSLNFAVAVDEVLEVLKQVPK